MEWKQIRSKMFLEASEIEKFVRFYDYSTKENFHFTDDKFCEFLISELRKIKGRLFDLVDIAYENHHDETSNLLVKVRDEVDIFSDEIKVRYCEFKDLPEEFVEKLIRHDYELIRGLQELGSIIPKYYNRVLNYEQIDTSLLKTMLDNLTRIFKEREAICNIKQISLEKSFEGIKDEIRSKI